MKERWRSIEGFEGLYEVSDLGQLRSIDRVVRSIDGRDLNYKGRILKTRIHKGYEEIRLADYSNGKRIKKNFLVHHLVLMTFRGRKPKNKCTRHLNGNSLDNRLSNLKYGTYEENAQDTVAHGNYPKSKPKLAPANVVAIFVATQVDSPRMKEIAVQFGTTLNTVWRIRKKEVWKDILRNL